MVLVIHFNFLKVETPYVPSGGVSFFPDFGNATWLCDAFWHPMLLMS